MRTFLKVSAAAIGVSVVAGGAVAYNVTHTNPLAVDAATFNAMNDQAELDARFANIKSQPVKLYRLMSCPYCARVRTLLDVHGVEYTTTVVDPITAAGVPTQYHEHVPQMQFLGPWVIKTSHQTQPAADPIVADSKYICSRICESMGWGAQLKDPKIEADREVITEVFARAAFIAKNHTWNDAWVSFPSLVPERYHFMVARAVGASALTMLANKKMMPRLQRATGTPENTETGLHEVFKNSAEGFTKKFEGSPFHGGKGPNLVDVELYGVLSTMKGTPSAEQLLQDSALGPWYGRMTTYTREKTRNKDAL